MAQTIFKENPEYREAFTAQCGVVFYVPAEVTGYHKSREMAMQAQEQYSRCGIGQDVLTSFTNKLLELANKAISTDTIRTDIGVIANNLQFRMKNIVDEECLLRMAAYGVFLENEDPHTVSEGYTRRKLDLCSKHPDIRDFFLHLGVAFTPTYETLLRGFQVEEFLRNREQTLAGLTLQSTRAGL